MMKNRTKCFGNQVYTARAKNTRFGTTKVMEEWKEMMLSQKDFMSTVIAVYVCIVVSV